MFVFVVTSLPDLVIEQGRHSFADILRSRLRLEDLKNQIPTNFDQFWAPFYIGNGRMGFDPAVVELSHQVGLSLRDALPSDLLTEDNFNPRKLRKEIADVEGSLQILLLMARPEVASGIKGAKAAPGEVFLVDLEKLGKVEATR